MSGRMSGVGNVRVPQRWLVSSVLLLVLGTLLACPGDARTPRPPHRRSVAAKAASHSIAKRKPVAKTKPAAHKAIVHSKPPPKSKSPAAPYRVASIKPVAIKPKAAVPPKPPVDRWAAMAVEIVAAGKGRINYDAGVVKAIGMGAIAPPTLKRSRAQDILDAREVAVNDALRNLAMAVSQVRVTADTRVQNYVLRSDEIRVRVEASMKGAQVIEEKVLPTSGVYRVVMQLRLRGPDSLLDAIEAAEADSRRAAVLAARAKEKAEAERPAPNPYAPGMPAPDDAEYTSLIVDCRGLGVVASPAPKLFDNRHNEVYGTMRVSPDYVNEVGIVSYPRSMDDARRTPRTGRHPLIVRACGIADEHRFHPMITERDANRIRSANESGHFFERTAVIFLVDPIR